MSTNDKHEEKWTLNFRDDQCQLISDAMKYIVARADERIGTAKYTPFEQFSAAQVKMRAEEIVSMIADVTS